MDSQEESDEDEEEEDEGNPRFKGSGGPKLGVLTEQTRPCSVSSIWQKYMNRRFGSR